MAKQFNRSRESNREGREVVLVLSQKEYHLVREVLLSVLHPQAPQLEGNLATVVTKYARKHT